MENSDEEIRRKKCICILVFDEEQRKFITSVIVAGRARTWVLGYWHVIMISYFRLAECWRFRWDTRYAMHTSDYSWDDLRVDAWGRRQVPTLPTSYQAILHLLWLWSSIMHRHLCLFFSSLLHNFHPFHESLLRLEHRFFFFSSFSSFSCFSYWYILGLYPLPKLARWITLWGKNEECCRVWWGCLVRSVANFQKGSLFLSVSASFSPLASFFWYSFWNGSNVFYILDARRVPAG